MAGLRASLLKLLDEGKSDYGITVYLTEEERAYVVRAIQRGRKRNKGVRVCNKEMNNAMWEDRKRGLTYGQLAIKYGLRDRMYVRSRFRNNGFPYRELTKTLNSSG